MEKDRLRQLAAAAQQGNTDAFSELYTGMYKSLYKTAYYLIGNAQDAEDTVMDTVADAYASIGKLRVAEAFEGWVYKILYNKARRKRGLIAYTATTELPETLEGNDPTAAAIGDHTDLLRALDTLSKEERAIVVLSVCEGYNSNEIGAVMSINSNTVRSKQMRALAKLRVQLEPSERGRG
jgi:RNA polymerase sigma-70 factor (ECF subfamily)